ncbi:hypothetical protein AB0K09_29910, partial [Streptomyces sp. NPDC049577]|uniref:hypothetical protein n=1 Tax=Streptomyces sp. NPDC049577 TaxID=3155153 RepID=UPI00342F1032
VCTGEEFGLELLSGDRTLRWPVASFGPLDEHCKPNWRTRTMPAALPAAAHDQLDAFVEDVTARLAPLGPWQIDFAVDDGRLSVLEINGRFGGMSHLSHAATRLDPYDALVRLVLDGTLPQDPPAVRTAMHLPLRLGVRLPPLPPGMTLTREHRTPTETGRPVHICRTLVAAEEPALRAWLDALPPDALAH